ncbi:MAG: protein kinase, partial [Candidatus Korobacteraceae bacterium]
MKLCPLCDTAYPNHHTNCERDGASLIASRDLEPGTVIRNKYRIVRTLGRGGMGTVYLADHILLGRQRALKFMSSDLSQDPKLLKRFRQEAQAAIELRHPNVAEVVDLDQAEDGSPYIAMEYVEGRDLRHVIDEGPMAVTRALLIARGVTLGLGVAHAKGIIHRDVKPENILIAVGAGGTETPKLLDFGIAAIKENTSEMSRTRGLMLTPQYAAPEQWMGMPADQVDGRVDLYALGCVLYEMLTGRMCFYPHNAQGWMYQHLQGDRQPPSRVRAELGQWPGLDALLLRLLAREREDRPRSATELLRELDGVRGRRPETLVLAQVETQSLTQVEMQAETQVETQIDSSVPSRRGVVSGTGTLAVGEKASHKSTALRWAIVAGVGLVVAALAVLGVKKSMPSKPVETLRENSRDGLQYAWIPPGTFEMGCSPGDSECKDDEKPAHAVSISKGFWMGQMPVTVGAWEQYRKATNAPALQNSDSLHRGSLNGAGYEDTPVILESWEQAASYCQWAGMTLPT